MSSFSTDLPSAPSLPFAPSLPSRPAFPSLPSLPAMPSAGLGICSSTSPTIAERSNFSSPMALISWRNWNATCSAVGGSLSLGAKASKTSAIVGAFGRLSSSALVSTGSGVGICSSTVSTRACMLTGSGAGRVTLGSGADLSSLTSLCKSVTCRISFASTFSLSIG